MSVTPTGVFGGLFRGRKLEGRVGAMLELYQVVAKSTWAEPAR